MFVYASYLTLTCIAIDRCLVVLYGVRYKAIMTKTVIIAMIVVSWVISFVIAFIGPQFVDPGNIIYQYHPDQSMCIVTQKEPVNPRLSGKSKTFDTFSTIVITYIPFIIIMSSSIVLIYLLSRRKESKSNIIRRSCVTVILMNAAYLICSALFALEIFVDNMPSVNLFTSFLIQMHCAIIPIIYLMRDSKFRRSVTYTNLKIPKMMNTMSSPIMMKNVKNGKSLTTFNVTSGTRETQVS